MTCNRDLLTVGRGLPGIEQEPPVGKFPGLRSGRRGCMRFPVPIAQHREWQREHQHMFVD